MWVPYSLAARLLVREVPLERCVLVPHEAVTTLEDTERTARRVLGGAHPTTVDIGTILRDARATLRVREEV